MGDRPHRRRRHRRALQGRRRHRDRGLLPGKGALATFSRRLDSAGNSVREPLGSLRREGQRRTSAALDQPTYTDRGPIDALARPGRRSSSTRAGRTRCKVRSRSATTSGSPEADSASEPHPPGCSTRSHRRARDAVPSC